MARTTSERKRRPGKAFWGTDEQEDYLIANYKPWLKAREKKSTGQFFANLKSGWFEGWPEPELEKKGKTGQVNFLLVIRSAAHQAKSKYTYRK